MAQSATMNVEIRDRAGKGAARAIRRAGRVPAVIYGNKIAIGMGAGSISNWIRDLPKYIK